MTTIDETQPVATESVLDRGRKHLADTMFYLGDISQLALKTITQAKRGPLEMDAFMAQLDQVGVRSLSIAGITSLFIGMVLALQTAYSLAEFGGKLFIGKVVSLSLIRERAPVLMALM